MKKTGLILSPNQRINLNTDSTRTRDIKGIRDYFIEIGYDVDIASYGKSRSFYDHGVINDCDTDYNLYDAIIVYNDTINFFGGQIKDHTVQQVVKLSKYKGDIFYVFTDPKLYKTIGQSLFNKKLITKDILDDYSNIQWNIIWPGVGDLPNFNGKIKQAIKVDILKYANRYLNNNRCDLDFDMREYDLVYYGDYRDTRIKTFDRFFNSNIKKLMIGMSGSNYPNSNYSKKVKQSDLPNVVCHAKSSLTCGDKSHNNNITTSRFYENNLYGVVNFIDLEYDLDRKLYKSEFLKDFLYVSSSKDLEDRLSRLDKDLFLKIISLQDKEIF